MPVTLTELRLPSLQSGIVWLAFFWLLLTEILVGFSLAVAGPSTTVLVVVMLVAPAALLIRAEHLVILTLGALFFSRLLVDFGAPSTLNFAHFPLAILALVKLLERPADQEIGRLIGWLAVSLALVLISSALTSWQAFRPLIAWITLIEPFVFFGLVASLDTESKVRLKTFAIWIAVAQIPFALSQFASSGVGDVVQGTLVGQGAGHHIMGAICAAAGWMLLFTAKRRSGLWILLGLALIAVGVLADAKQVYGALIAAVLVAGVFQLRSRRGAATLLLPAAILLAIIFASAQFYSPMERVLNKEIVAQVTGDKVEQATAVVGELGLDNSLLGVGAGNGLSRTSLASVPGYGNVPALLIGDEPSAIALRELRGFDTIGTSSVDSPFSSWIGIYTDSGVLGLALYLVLAFSVSRILKNSDEGHRKSSYMLLTFAVLLGFIFTWLEEPAFTVFLAVLLASGVRPAQSTGRRGLSVALQGLTRPLSAFRGSS